jgi:murein DD-endopeptidase MepM/ murein hydrolase activator NlpD
VRPNGKWHKGLDIAAPTGTPAVAIVPGTLSYLRDPRGWGLYASLEFQPKRRRQDGTCEALEPMRFIYAHLIDDDPGLVTGQERSVIAGQIVGRVGCSGNAMGMCSPSPESHLHLTLRQAKGERAKVDPLPVVQWTLLTPDATAFQPPYESCPWP